MKLQYITDNQGKQAGIFISTTDWDLLKIKYQDLEANFSTIPEWHKSEVRERIVEYKAKPKIALDFDEVMEHIVN